MKKPKLHEEESKGRNPEI